MENKTSYNSSSSGNNFCIADLMATYKGQIKNPVSIQCHAAHNNGATHTNNNGPWAETHTETYSN